MTLALINQEVKIIMTSLAEAVVYMHNKDMVHRDLKLENILLSNDLEPGCKYNIKVTDFGLSHMKGLSGSDGLMSTRCGTLYYMAPEVIRNKLEYSKLCDVWSMGVIMYALLCGSMPFKGETASQLEDQIMSGELGFKEVEWITISDGGKLHIITSKNI
jgi:serine/threonine kinase 33